eukprot:1152346-Prorocentrum_minimum.AAC.1
MSADFIALAHQPRHHRRAQLSILSHNVYGCRRSAKDEHYNNRPFSRLLKMPFIRCRLLKM